jgi:hypothetical protein
VLALVVENSIKSAILQLQGQGHKTKMSCALEPNDKQQTDQSVWYRVTIQTGKEIKFYGAHKLKVPAECIICDFISHVKSHSHNIPEDSENCSISAIRNRLSFDLNEPPLGRSSKINQLGSIISEAIIIYVYDHSKL